MGKRVSLFVTCIVDQLFPKVGLAMADVLERIGMRFRQLDRDHTKEKQEEGKDKEGAPAKKPNEAFLSGGATRVANSYRKRAQAIRRNARSSISL